MNLMWTLFWFWNVVGMSKETDLRPLLWSPLTPS